MSMTIRISGEDRFGKRSLLNDKPISEYSADEVTSMVDSSCSVSVFLKDETRAEDAKSLVADFFSHFEGDIISKATKYGWVVTQELRPTRDDATSLRALLAKSQ